MAKTYLRVLIQRAIDSGDLLSCTQVAERLSVTLETVEKWCRAGTLPALKLGGHERTNEWIVIYEDFQRFQTKRPDFAEAFKDTPRLCPAWSDWVDGGCTFMKNHTPKRHLGRAGTRTVTWTDADNGSHLR